MKATLASGRYPLICRTYMSSSSARSDSGPNSSWAARTVSDTAPANFSVAHLRYGEPCQQPLEKAASAQLAQPASLVTAESACQLCCRPKCCVAERTSSLFAVPGGPISSKCSPQMAASSSSRTCARQSQKSWVTCAVPLKHASVSRSTSPSSTTRSAATICSLRASTPLSPSPAACEVLACGWARGACQLLCFFGSAKPRGRASSRAQAPRTFASVNAANCLAESAFTASISSSMRCSCESRRQSTACQRTLAQQAQCCGCVARHAAARAFSC